LAGGSAWLLAACGKQFFAHAIAQDGAITSSGAVAVKENIQFAAASRNGDRIHLACSDGGIGRPGTRHLLQVLHADSHGRLKDAGAIGLPQRPVHIAIDETNARAHLAFNLPSAYACVSLGPDGSPVAVEHYVRDRAIVGWFAHQVLPLERSGAVLLACRGDDAAPSAPENPGSLRMLAIERGEVRIAQVVAPAGGIGFGPRNAALSPDGRFLFVVLERQNRLEVFPHAGGKLSAEPNYQVPTLSTCNPDQVRQLAGDICVHPTGRFAYVLNRSRDPRGENNVAVFTVDADTGQPRHLESLDLPGRHPRSVRISADGSLMAIAVMEPDEGASQPAGVLVASVGVDGRLSGSRHWPSPAASGPVMWADIRRPSC